MNLWLRFSAFTVVSLFVETGGISAAEESKISCGESCVDPV